MSMPLSLTAEYVPPRDGWGARVQLFLNGRQFLTMGVPREISGEVFERMSPDELVWHTVTDFVQVMHMAYAKWTDDEQPSHR